MPPPPIVIRVHPAHHPEILETLTEALCRAFEQDAHINWIIRQDARCSEAFQRFFRLLLTDQLGDQGEVYATADLKAAAIGFPPGASSMSVLSQARVGLRFAAITGWPSLLLKAYGLNAMEARHPGIPHYFLQTIGVDPDYQGQGYGSAVLSAILGKCDAAGAPAYLETSNESNLSFYAGRGFQIVAEARLPRGPRLWQMLRLAGKPAPD
jgi:ribosomal protein S18 acetylase RimI-like enzyme